MADVGRSTVAHSHHDNSMEEALRDWGRWQRCLPSGTKEGISVSPTFREYISGYPEDSMGLVLPDDPEAACELDALIAQLDEKYIYCLILNYILKQSSRNAAKTLTYLSEKTGAKMGCTYQTYLNWLNKAAQMIEQKWLDNLTI